MNGDEIEILAYASLIDMAAAMADTNPPSEAGMVNTIINIKPRHIELRSEEQITFIPLHQVVMILMKRRPNDTWSVTISLPDQRSVSIDGISTDGVNQLLDNLQETT